MVLVVVVVVVVGFDKKIKIRTENTKNGVARPRAGTTVAFAFLHTLWYL